MNAVEMPRLRELSRLRHLVQFKRNRTFAIRPEREIGYFNTHKNHMDYKNAKPLGRHARILCPAPEAGGVLAEDVLDVPARRGACRAGILATSSILRRMNAARAR